MTRCYASPEPQSSPIDNRGGYAGALLRPAAEMRALFADLPEACDNTLL